jgi:hypothetical protein
MTEHEHSQYQRTTGGSFWASRYGLVLLAFLAMAGVLLFTEHRAHVLGILPFLFLLACPLLHMFGHGGHGGHAGHGRGDQTGPDPRGSTGTRDSSKGEKS